jgi:ribose-phosphate pyrophosphokinase
MILPGSASQAFAAALADATGQWLCRIEYERFPDGELLVELADTPDRAVVVASTTTAKAHVELLQLQDAAREAGAEEVLTVLPYMGYGRQDRAFQDGQPVSARAVARAISTGTDRVVTVTPHEAGVLEHFDAPATAVDAADRLAAPLPADLADPLFLSPDEGAVDIAESVRNAYGSGEVDVFQKERNYDSGAVSVQPSDAAVADRDVVVADDIIATGSTMSEAVGVLAERNAARIYAACVHPVLAGNALTRLRGAGVERVIGTDTIERSVSAVSAAPSVADEL